MDLHQAFHHSHQVCPTCAKPVQHEENKIVCSHCGFEEYDNPSPCVSLMVVQDGQFLFAKRAVEPAKGMWDVLGGFVEAGESSEEAAIREMKEETGLETSVEAYLGSTWDVYTHNRPTLVTAYLMKIEGSQPPQPQEDVAKLQWFPLDSPPETFAFRHIPYVVQKTREYLASRKDA